ncbi:MAG TPA: glycosyltransferase [Thermoanaerobaculia bacterium]|jgi:glycosyltransferase involved in cell wall biosynthesis|nr:glycosyltransferase [Thermoanaerobaculia bacterium]
MRLAVVLERPTQFDVPLFRHAAGDGQHELRVLYTDPRAAAPAFDPELGRNVGWGADVLVGYDCAAAPGDGTLAWLRHELAGRRDLVIVNGYTRLPYLVANAAARRAGSPTALRLDSVLFDEGTGARRLVKRAVFRLGVRRLFRLFLGVGTLTLEYLRQLGVPVERTGLFPYPVDVDGLRARLQPTGADRRDVRARLGIPADVPLVLAVAKLHPRETPWDLLHAWVEAAPLDRWLVLAGDGPERAAVEAFVAERQLPRVRLVGYVPYPELPGLFRAADVFVHAPREERWGVSVAEALACGTPVVASDRVGATRDLVLDGRNGFCYPAGIRAALARTIGEALRLPREAVNATSDEVLAGWNLESTWRGLLSAAARVNAR